MNNSMYIRLNDDESTRSMYRALPSERGQLFYKSPNKTPYSSPCMARYGASFLDWNADLYHVPVSAMVYAIPFDIVPRYSDIGLYIRL